MYLIYKSKGSAYRFESPILSLTIMLIRISNSYSNMFRIRDFLVK